MHPAGGSAADGGRPSDADPGSSVPYQELLRSSMESGLPQRLRTPKRIRLPDDAFTTPRPPSPRGHIGQPLPDPQLAAPAVPSFGDEDATIQEFLSLMSHHSTPGSSDFLARRLERIIERGCQRIFSLTKDWLLLAGKHHHLLELHEQGVVPKTLSIRAPGVRLFSEQLDIPDEVRAALSHSSHLLFTSLLEKAKSELDAAYAKLNEQLPQPSQDHFAQFVKLTLRALSDEVDSAHTFCSSIRDHVASFYEDQMSRAFSDFLLRARSTVIDAHAFMRRRNVNVRKFLDKDKPAVAPMEDSAAPTMEDRIATLEQELKQLRLQRISFRAPNRRRKPAKTFHRDDPARGPFPGTRRRSEHKGPLPKSQRPKKESKKTEPKNVREADGNPRRKKSSYKPRGGLRKRRNN